MGIIEGESTDYSSMAFEYMCHITVRDVPDFHDTVGGARGKKGRSRVGCANMDGRVMCSSNRPGGMNLLLRGLQRLDVVDSERQGSSEGNEVFRRCSDTERGYRFGILAKVRRKRV